MARYYEIRANREAWATSIAIHIWLLALLLWLPLASKTPAPTQPLELTMIDLGGPAGDRAQGTDRPAPKPLVRAHARPVYQPDTIAEPRPIAHHESPVSHSRPVARPKIETVAQPDPAALAAEEKRRRKLEQEQLADAADTDSGAKDGAAGATGTTAHPVSGGAVSVGHGASGDLAGRTVIPIRPEFPASAESRHPVGWRGTVVATLRVAPDGHVSSVDLVRSSGDSDIDATALDAFRSYRFSPLPQGQQVDQVGQVKMRFVLK